MNTLNEKEKYYHEWVKRVTLFLEEVGPNLGNGGRSCSVMQSRPVLEKDVDVVFLGCNPDENWGYCGVENERFFNGNKHFYNTDKYHNNNAMLHHPWKIWYKLYNAFASDCLKNNTSLMIDGNYVYMNAYYFGTKTLKQLDSLPGIEPLKKKCLEYTKEIIQNVFRPKLIVCFSIPNCFDELDKQCHFQDVHSSTPLYPNPDKYTCKHTVKTGIWDEMRIVGIPHPSQAISNDDWGCIGNFILEQIHNCK